jgi:hypothetical protein
MRSLAICAALQTLKSKLAQAVGNAKKLNSVALVRERTIPTERSPFFLAKLVPTFADRGCRVVSATDSHGR